MGWGGKKERGSGWGTHVNPWLIHVIVWQKPLQYFNVISLQLIKINEKKKERECVCMCVHTERVGEREKDKQRKMFTFSLTK